MINQLLEELTDIKATEESAEKIDLNTLISENFTQWNKIKKDFKNNFLFFEELLFKIHFKRKKKLTKIQRNNIIKFLSIGYLFSNDIRYLNEFLWFHKDHEEYKLFYSLMLNRFKANTKGKYHSFPLCTIDDVNDFVKLNTKETEQNNETPINTPKIGLLGPPFFFKKVYWRLIKEGFNVKVFSLLYDSNRKKRMFLKSGLLFLLFNFINGVRFKYETIEFKPKDEKITDILKEKELDIGFHKLGFILKKNLLDCFKIGLLNDHWAILPFVRGRSTIEYSIILGFPMCVTTHFVDEGIDTGSIVKIFPYTNLSEICSSVAEIKKKIKSDLENRIFDSIKNISMNKNQIKNEKTSGLTFYSMHDTLLNYVEKEILGKNQV